MIVSYCRYTPPRLKKASEWSIALSDPYRVIDQIAMIIREVQLERRVADYVVEFPQRAVLILVERVFQSISLNHVSQRMAHTVKDKIQHHHSRRLVADVLGIDRAVLFPYFVSQSNHERTSTGRRLK